MLFGIHYYENTTYLPIIFLLKNVIKLFCPLINAAESDSCPHFYHQHIVFQ